MLKTISRENKRALGSLIRLERIKAGITREQMIFDNQGKSICSISTLYRLEKGDVIQDDIIYLELIKRLNKVYENNGFLDNAISDLNDKLMNYFETLNAAEADCLLAYIKSFNKVKSFYYQQIFAGYLDILCVNLNQKKLTSEEYEYYKKMMVFMPEPYNVLLLHLCFCYANNYNQDISEMHSYEALLTKYQNYLIIQVDILILLKCEHRLFEYQKVHSEVLKEIDKRNLINQKCKVLSFHVGAIAIMQKLDLNRVLNELEQLIFKEKQFLNPVIYNNTLVALAMIYYVDIKDYNKATALFEKLLIEDFTKIYSSGIYYFSSCDLINIKPSPEIINRIDTNHASVYLQYFYYKYSKNLSLPDLIHYLKTKVLDELKKNGNQLKISVFKSQWNLLISENTKKYYKDYYRFIKNFE
ncbi:hypothetical protein [Holdemania massiliensis]